MGRIFDFALIGGALVVLIFILVYSIKLTTGVAKSISAPENQVRLEILNASSEKGLETKMKQYLSDLKDEHTEINVVSTGVFDLEKSKSSFIINRVKEASAVNAMARLIDIDKDNISYSELEQNNDQITATLVLGDDSLYYRLMEKQKESK